MSTLNLHFREAAKWFGAVIHGTEAATEDARVARRKRAFPKVEDISSDLVLAAQGGDIEAFGVIVHALDRIVYQTVYRFVGSRYNADVEDITQEIFIKLHRNLVLFDVSRGTKFHSWVLALTRNYCFDVLKRRRLPTVSLGALSENEGENLLPSGSSEPVDEVAGHELRDRIAVEVRGLPEQQRFAFVLREYEGLSYQEIAQASECSEGTVKSRIHRAKESLRRRLSPLLSQLSR